LGSCARRESGVKQTLPIDAAGHPGGVFDSGEAVQARVAKGGAKKRRKNQKGVAWVSPTDASLIVRFAVGCLARRLGAVGCEPMRGWLLPPLLEASPPPGPSAFRLTALRLGLSAGPDCP
jgi:hypothetical protein